MLPASAGSGTVANHASSISCATCGLVRRRLMTRTFASFHRRAPPAVSASVQSAARTPRTLFAAIDAPVPVQQNRTPVSASCVATCSPTRRPTSAHCRSSPAGGPTSTTSAPRSRRSSTTASVSAVRSSDPTTMRTAVEATWKRVRVRFGVVVRMLLAIVLVAAVTLVAWALDVDLTVAALLLLVAVIVAGFFGFIAAATAAIVAFLALNWFFTPPTGSLAIERSDDVVALIVFAVTAILLGVTVQRLGVLALTARRGEREAQLRLDLTNRLLEGDSIDDALSTTVSTLRDVFGFASCSLRMDDHVVTTGDVRRAPDISVVVRNVRLDATSDDELSPGDRALLEALVAGLATAADRLRLQDEVRDAQVVAEIGRQRAGFLSAVSHNLRTPLTAVKAAAATLLASWSRIEPEERRELLETIADEAERLERLVRNTLELSRIRAGALDVERERVDIADLVQHAVRRLRPIARAHRVRLDVDDDLPLVSLDVTMAEQILLNLLENALRFAPPGSEIVVGAHAVPEERRDTNGDEIELVVTDHGPGVPAEARGRIFEEFQSAETRPDRTGTGLGLAIVRALVVAHGGSVRYEDTPGGGATFVCTFPREARAA